ncbi:hypothetical protein P8452_24810 [Trifolium repens]|nr:hypothetical protein P8452_24810 [Trifolium repens]
MQFISVKQRDSIISSIWFALDRCSPRFVSPSVFAEGGFVDDFLSHLTCCCCALVQEWREVEIRRVSGSEKTKTSPPPSQGYWNSNLKGEGQEENKVWYDLEFNFMGSSGGFTNSENEKNGFTILISSGRVDVLTYIGGSHEDIYT